MDNKIFMERFSYGPDGTFGRLLIPGEFECMTVERPWVDNKARESCIPEGIYSLGLRDSPVVKRITNGSFDEGWEVQDVPGRTYIMIHPGNWPKNFLGCIGVGKEYMVISGVPGVTASQGTFKQMREVMDVRNDWELHISQFRPEYG